MISDLKKKENVHACILYDPKKKTKKPLNINMSIRAYKLQDSEQYTEKNLLIQKSKKKKGGGHLEVFVCGLTEIWKNSSLNKKKISFSYYFSRFLL